MTACVLAKIPNPLKVEGATYPVLRIFASHPGNAKLERTLQQRIQRKGRSKQGKHLKTEVVQSSSDDICDPDKHPLATLNVKLFRKETRRLDG